MFYKSNPNLRLLAMATLTLAIAMLGLDYTASPSFASPSLAEPSDSLRAVDSSSFAVDQAEDIPDQPLDLPPVYGMCLPAENGAGECSACTGIEPLHLRLSAGGYMLDFRYRIEDPIVAETWLEHMPPPFLELPESGIRLMVPSSPKVGPLRQTQRPGTPSRVGSVRFAMFANPGQRVQSGQWVKIHFGELSGWLVVQ